MKILELIKNEIIEIQEDLAEKLRRDGIQVTQATVSRDIKEMQLIKVPAGDGRYRYAQPDDPAHTAQSDRMLRIFRECILSLDHNDSLVVITTLPATAQGVAEAIDGLRWKEVLGTLAGERNVFAAVKPREAAPLVIDKLRHLMSQL